MTRRRHGGRRGATTIEFALVLPVFVMLVLGVFDTGWLFWQNAAMQVAVEDGCREGSIRDAGQGRSGFGEIQTFTEEEVVDRLEALGIGCYDCAVSVTAVDVNGVYTLSCAMTRSVQSLGGVYAGIDLETSNLAQFEVQR